MTASKHERTKGQTNHIAEAIALLDEIDGMAFGKVDAALNHLNSKLLLAQAEQEQLVGVLANVQDWLERGDIGDADSILEMVAKVRESALSLAKTEG